jgi:hypothetical protein
VNFLTHILTYLIPALTTTSFDLTGKCRMAKFAERFTDAAMVIDVDLAPLYAVANCDHLQNLTAAPKPGRRSIGFLTHEHKDTPKATKLTKGRKAP